MWSGPAPPWRHLRISKRYALKASTAGDVEGVGSNDFFIVARARDEETAAKALAVGEAAVLSAKPGRRWRTAAKAPRSLREALRAQPGFQRRGDLGAG